LRLSQKLADRTIIRRHHNWQWAVWRFVSRMLVMVMATVTVRMRIAVNHSLSMSVFMAMMPATPQFVQSLAQHASRAVGQQQQPGSPTNSAFSEESAHRAPILAGAHTNGNRFANDLQIEISNHKAATVGRAK
jgi:hypothetical protein